MGIFLQDFLYQQIPHQWWICVGGAYMHPYKCKISLLATYKLLWCYRRGQFKHKTGAMFISKLLEIDQTGQRERNWKKTAMG